MAELERSNIEDLQPTTIPNLDAVVPAMHEGQTVKLSIAQILALATIGIDDKVSKSGDTMSGPLELIEADLWRYRCRIGDYYCADTSLTGVDIPPSTIDGPVFIQLTAGLTGAGQYNHGKIINETVSGSAPDVLATAVIDFQDSPMDGQTIRLINTEARIIRPYPTAGTILGDAIRNITGSVDDVWSTQSVGTDGAISVSIGVNSNRPAVGTANTRKVVLNASNQVPTANENRMKMLGETWYRRIA